MEIGKRIKDRRKTLGISAEQLADAIGVSPATIYRYESGNIENMGIDKLTPIAKYLRTNEAYLMGWVNDPTGIINSEPSEHALSNGEEFLIRCYRELNTEGQEKVLGYTEDLISSGRYIKSNPDRVVDE